MQTKLGSLVESWVNIAIGFTINYVANLIILPMFWGPARHNAGLSAFVLGIAFTLISFARQYVLRRWFNGMSFGNKKEVVVNVEMPDRR